MNDKNAAEKYRLLQAKKLIDELAEFSKAEVCASVEEFGCRIKRKEPKRKRK